MLFAAAPAFAVGGNGASEGACSGGTGGTDNGSTAGSVGGNGTNCGGSFSGGGGGGAGVNGGGNGGEGSGAFGTGSTGVGVPGGDAVALTGGGGGGGSHGALVSTSATNNGTIAGTRGGNGGSGALAGGGGGGGGAGGAGVVTSGSVTYTNNGTITGANGGAGGFGGAGSSGGQGGSGGLGVIINGGTLINAGTITAANGGAGGDGNGAGNGGSGGNAGDGVQIDGSTINLNGGTISAGTGGAGGTGTVNGTAGANGFAIHVFNLNLTPTDVLNLSGAFTLNGGIQIENGATLTINPVSTSTLTNVISGAGNIVAGSGTLVLDGVNTYTGSTTVASGATLFIGDATTPSARIARSVTVSSGGTLSGYGTIAGNVTNSGTLFPGGTNGSIGSLSILAGYTQAASGTLKVEVSPAAASKLAVSDGATLAAGTGVSVVYDPGTYTAKSYNILHANGGLTAGTINLTGTAPSGFSQSLNTGANDLNLALTANPASAASAPAPITVTTTTGVFGDAAVIAISGASGSDDIVFDHLDEQQFGEGADQVKTALAGAAPMQVAMNGPLQQLSQAGSQLPNALAQYGAWVRGVGNFLDVDNQGNASGFSASGGGLLAGIDHPFGPVTLGVAGGYSGTDFTQNDGETGDIQTLRAMVYAHYRAAPPIVVDGIAGFAYDRIHTERPITALGGNASESHNGFEQNLAVQAGYVVPWQGFTLIPRIGAQYLHLSENGFSETGGSGFDLSRGRQNVDSFQPSIGMTALKPFALDNGMRVTPAFKLTYSHELLNPNETLALTTPAASIIPASVVTPAHNTVTLGPSATLRLKDSVNLYADYKLSIGIGKSLGHVLFAGARFTW